MAGLKPFLKSLRRDLKRHDGERWTPGIWAFALGLPLATAVVIGAATRAIDDALRKTIATASEAVLEANEETIRAEVRDILRDVRAVTRDPAVVVRVRGLIEEGPSAAAAGVSTLETFRRLREEVGDYLDGGAVLGFAVTDLSGVVVKPQNDRPVGERLSSKGMHVLGAAVASETGIFRPFVPPVLINYLGSNPREVSGLFACAFRDPENSRPFAVFWVLVDPADPFAEVLTAGEFAKTGETYVFDADGRMLSRSRFAEAISANVIGGVSPGEILLRDPGVDLTRRRSPNPETSWPETHPVLAIRQGEFSGTNIKGYRNYRGAEVIGGWVWMPELGVGLIAEMEREEALRLIRPLRFTVFGLSGFSVVVLLLLVRYRFRITRLRRNLDEIEQLGCYTLGQKIGEGGMGSVFRAHHTLLRRPTAIKLIGGPGVDDLTLARFEREVRHTSRLTHPSTISIYDFGRTPEGIFYYAMELVDGLTFSHLVDISGAQDPARVIHMLEQIAGSLEEAHAEGLVHRDIKPGNLMLCFRPVLGDVVKVLDFGLVKDTRGFDPEITKADQVFGTALYMAPERMRDPKTATPAVDIYALGSVAFVLLTGKETFEGVSDIDLIQKVLESDPPRPSAHASQPIPAELDDLVVSMLAPDPVNRPASMHEIHQALVRLAIEHPWSIEQAEASWAQSAFDAIRSGGDQSQEERTLMSVVLEDRLSDSARGNK